MLEGSFFPSFFLFSVTGKDRELKIELEKEGVVGIWDV